MEDITPMLRQYLEVKSNHQDAILMFRMGDFYEMFFDDAILASKILNITLTSRDRNDEKKIPMCGVPHHSVHPYISKLLSKGMKVAMCDQVEDPKKARGLVRREVVKIFTPGVVIEGENLDEKRNNYLISIERGEKGWGVGIIDISTGDFKVLEAEERDVVLNEVAKFEPGEIILPERLKGTQEELELKVRHPVVNFVSNDLFTPLSAIENVSIPIGIEDLAWLESTCTGEVMRAAGAIVRYISENFKGFLPHITKISRWTPSDFMVLDESTIRNLELFETLSGEKRGSLIDTIDMTCTPMGTRLLRRFLTYPLRDISIIRERLFSIRFFFEKNLLRSRLRDILSKMGDFERVCCRVAAASGNARDLLSIKNSLLLVKDIKLLFQEITPSPESKKAEPPFNVEGDEIPEVIRDILSSEIPEEVITLIQDSINENPPITIKEGDIIKKGYNAELDELVKLSKGGKEWLLRLEEEERKKTNIQSLKVRYNKVFGYYIEVTKPNLHLVPERWRRRQTLVNAERFITPELKEWEDRILSAETKRKELEYELFCEIREKVSKRIEKLKEIAHRIAILDLLSSMAEVAVRFGYSMPVVNDGERIEIKGGRHPVIERMPLQERFVPNDILLDRKENQILLITGPNMAGKSTVLRQTALIILLAQAGFFVPADRAEIGMVDRIFTRIGASDIIHRGQSTFMVEMTEASNILHNATDKSFIILDEIGRGTSTFDGLSIAWAVTEFIHDRIGARTLFATHYHELTALSEVKERVKNYNIAVTEWGDKIVFLRKLKKGGTSKSYGIQVARLAGLPKLVIDRAFELLKDIEKVNVIKARFNPISRSGTGGSLSKERGQLLLFGGEEEHILKELKDLEVEKLTPLEALNILSRLIEKAKKG